MPESSCAHRAVADYRTVIVAALRDELGLTHQAVKTALRWTGASERAVKYWIAGERGPSGEHLIALARHSDIVFHMVLLLADRQDDEDAE
ncbi:MAG: helix-turn-helix domain-containing protein [Planctomycetaceae bacterium]